MEGMEGVRLFKPRIYADKRPARLQRAGLGVVDWLYPTTMNEPYTRQVQDTNPVHFNPVYILHSLLFYYPYPMQ